MLRRKRTEGFNLAFLDIMACGLGAVILVFMLVKQNLESAASEVDRLQADIARLEQTQQEANQTLRQIRDDFSQQKQDLEQQSSALADRQAALSAQRSAISDAEQALAKLKSRITEIEIPEQQDLVSSDNLNEENYLMGLQVTGNKIGILVDMSASMTNEKLIDIIQTKSRTNQDKQSAAKWIRTKNTVRWLLARLPANSDIVVVAFSEQAQVLGGQSMQPANETTVGQILQSLDKVIPEGGTNLQKGLNTINDFSPDHLYVITDGLPTLGESSYRSLNPFAQCRSLTGNAQTISGPCRVKLFQQTVRESGQRSNEVNVVLLPLEGDPDAVNQYWGWAAATGGLLISPAENWP
ncbi:Secreted protein, containing von Willebrand factor (vWF) type A domain [Methylophaga frappieri]|uniref:Secreted protein, containing von Willebrand factor (VWF) type A domain n=1 Tax=Methylophaga frappieri (strain ATCC BAA-2434 / DSM 25690 / JAM7) TaxID=754477 RepID=I1YLA7_METFJ|nr:vWA domain-containing protein [Methylophaga frappieri]AFJ03700.1 Secreted protein, containing von Willebrand factor (vWF) type A domain [Methylophaga frappieri]